MAGVLSAVMVSASNHDQSVPLGGLLQLLELWLPTPLVHKLVRIAVELGRTDPRRGMAVADGDPEPSNCASTLVTLVRFAHVLGKPGR